MGVTVAMVTTVHPFCSGVQECWRDYQEWCPLRQPLAATRRGRSPPVRGWLALSPCRFRCPRFLQVRCPACLRDARPSREGQAVKPKHALGALIEDTIERNHWTQETVAERARSNGFKMSTQNLSRIKNAPLTTLVPEQVRAIAAGLQLPVSVVLEAALESLGFTNDSSRHLGVEEAAKYDHRLSARDRRILAAVVNALLATDDEKVGGERADRSAPKTPAGDGPASKVHDLNQPDQGDPPPPPLDRLAARNLGTPSRGQQLRDDQDRDAESPDQGHSPRR